MPNFDAIALRRRVFILDRYCEGRKGRRKLTETFLDKFVNFLSMYYAKNQNIVTGNLKNNTVISNSQFPVTFKCSLQWLSINFRVCSQPPLDSSFDPVPIFDINFREVRFLDVRVILEVVYHSFLKNPDIKTIYHYAITP